ncbi:MAG: 50S ribosomal protein L13 [Candidatus Diapherotrites archaeon]|nr:50S ribosomal protein L13 [Candidatus Diapherotrites archaeon]
MAIIDAKEHVVGRLSSIVAQRALMGERIDIINAEKAVVIGQEEVVVQRWRRRINLTRKGNPERGPKFPKRPDKILKKAITGMLPNKTNRGKKAEKRVRVFIGIPKGLDANKAENIRIAKYNGKEAAISLEELCKKLGAKW